MARTHARVGKANFEKDGETDKKVDLKPYICLASFFFP